MLRFSLTKRMIESFYPEKAKVCLLLVEEGVPIAQAVWDVQNLTDDQVREVCNRTLTVSVREYCQQSSNCHT